ncbi:hypothetical protein, partial [Rickettsia asembonensis]|uniref:hypothetical protein n=1 Tax=Rickettsia asembonensis TaxID=1068590 RepID=UPI001F51802B
IDIKSRCLLKIIFFIIMSYRGLIYSTGRFFKRSRCHPREVLLRRPVKPMVSPRGLTTGAIKTIKNTNSFSIFNWIPRSSRGMTIENRSTQQRHAGMT